MNPNYVHTITVYSRKDDGSYTRTVLKKCFWHSATVVTQSGTNASQSNVYTVRIPLEVAGPDFCVSLNNDFVVLGECADEISSQAGYRAIEVMNRYKPNAFKVTAFTGNTDHPADRHYRLGG